MQAMSVYITAPTQKEADEISRELLKNKLVACTNQWGPVHSRFWWEGEIQDAQEWVMVAKSQAHLSDSILETVRKVSSSSVPCVLFTSLNGGEPAYLQWLQGVLSQE